MLVVYGIQEGASIMSRAYELKTRLRGVYMTVAPTKPEWSALGDVGNFVVTPGQWSDQAITPCAVFGSASDYVVAFEQMFAYFPDYNVAMSSFAGVVMQLALQVGAYCMQRFIPGASFATGQSALFMHAAVTPMFPDHTIMESLPVLFTECPVSCE